MAVKVLLPSTKFLPGESEVKKMMKFYNYKEGELLKLNYAFFGR
jgi:hypothetical protein